MNIDRRSLIKGIAACTLAGPLVARPMVARAWFDPAAPAPRHPDLVLVAAGTADSAFVHGLRAGSGARSLPVQATRGELPFLLDLERRLRSGQPLQVVGLLDDAVAAPLLELARGAGARVPWLGQHTVESGLSRHRLLTTATAGDRGVQLARGLIDCGDGFTLVEERREQATTLFELSGPPRHAGPADQWAASLGWLLGSAGAARMSDMPPLPAGRSPLPGSFVSFSIQA